jgi:hypothetical protein
VVAAVAAAVVAGTAGYVAVHHGGGSSSTAASTTSTPNQGQAGFGGVAGTLDSVKGSTLTLTNRAGQTVTVATSSSTAVTKSESGSLGDVKVGDLVTAAGTADADGAVQATRIMDQGTASARAGAGRGGFGGAGTGAGTGTSAPGSGAGRRNGTGFGSGGNGAIGTVKSVSDSSLVLTGFNGSDVTVTTDPSTVVTVMQPVKLSALAVGQAVTVRGTTGSNGTVHATSVQQGSGFGGGGFGGGGFGGRRGTTGSTTT